VINADTGSADGPGLADEWLVAAGLNDPTALADQSPTPQPIRLSAAVPVSARVCAADPFTSAVFPSPPEFRVTTAATNM
jgi:hypothetical protein